MGVSIRDIDILEMEGTHYSMGLQHGEEFRYQIRTLYKLRLKNAIRHALELGNREVSEAYFLKIANHSYGYLFNYDVNMMDEIKGIAHGSGLTTDQIFAMQGLTDFRDIITFKDQFFEGCTALCLDNSKTKSGNRILAQTWDLGTDNMPHVICLKKKYQHSGLETCSLTVTGGIDMAGMNSHGLCTLTNNLKSNDCQTGIPYLNILTKCLRAKKISDAIRYVIAPKRAGGHFYLLSTNEDTIGIECTAEHHRSKYMFRGKMVHTNHYVDKDLKKFECFEPSVSSSSRLERASKLCNGTKHTTESVKKILSDNSCGKSAINRKDYDGVSTNGSIIMVPAERKILVSRAYPDNTIWKEINLS
jgi:isopenicillin-N N-acyltransferase-like protein